MYVLMSTTEPDEYPSAVLPMANRQIQRQRSIYGAYPYNRLGLLPNADNLVLTVEPRPPTRSLDQVDLTTGGSSSSARAPITPIDRLFGIVKDNTNSMVNLIIVAIVLVAENLVKGNLFTCPCEKPQNALYGIAFLAAPAAALFVVGIMANNKTWMLVTGCCDRHKSDYPGQHHSGCYHVMGIITKAFVAPLAWVIISFIDGKFYACAASVDPCGTSDNLFLRSKSQVIGYIIMMVAMFAAIFGMLLWRALRPMSYEQDHYINVYRAMERVEIHRQFEEHAQGVARQNVQEFLAKESRSKKDWDYIAHVPSLTPTHGPEGLSPSMSPLNKLVQKERRESLDQAAKCSQKQTRTVETQCSRDYVPLQELNSNGDKRLGDESP